MPELRLRHFAACQKSLINQTFLMAIYPIRELRGAAAGGRLRRGAISAAAQLAPRRNAGAQTVSAARRARALQLPSSEHSSCGRLLKTCHWHVFLTHRPPRAPPSVASLYAFFFSSLTVCFIRPSPQGAGRRVLRSGRRRPAPSWTPRSSAYREWHI